MRTKLDKVFSEFIRLRDERKGCITCGAPLRFAECDAGHFIGRRHTATRWNEKNVHAQCKKCNQFESGKVETYRNKLVFLYGEHQVQELEQEAKKTVLLRDSDLKELIAQYKNKIKQLKNTLKSWKQ